MSESEISTILASLNEMRRESADNFKTVFNKIDGVCERVSILEGDKIARDAVTLVEEKIELKKIDWGKTFVRSAMAVAGVAGIAILAFLWKIIIGSVKIIEVLK